MKEKMKLRLHDLSQKIEDVLDQFNDQEQTEVETEVFQLQSATTAALQIALLQNEILGVRADDALDTMFPGK